MILVAGGAGYIGSYTNKLLNLRGHKTLVLDNLSTGHRDLVTHGEFVHGDLGDMALLRECFRSHPIKAVMHFSAVSLVGQSLENPSLYYRNNVSNTLNLLDAMREAGVGQFILSSTCAVYGNPVSIPLTEDHPRQPLTPYGMSKLMVENILADYERAYGLRHVSLRYFNAAGADPEGQTGERHAPETHLVPLAIQAALGVRDSVSVFGTDYPTRDGTCIRDYIHVADLADAHIRALEYLESGGRSEALNLGTDSGTTVREIIDEVRRASAKDFRVIEAGRREGDTPVLISSSEKARKTLGWQPRHTLESIIGSALSWHRKDLR